jgi:hypothetical protein
VRKKDKATGTFKLKGRDGEKFLLGGGGRGI